MNKKNEAPKENISYVKLGVHIRKYLESKYGKSPLTFPYSSPLYSCIEKYIVNNYTLSPVSLLSYSDFAFHYEAGNPLFNEKTPSLPSAEDKPEFIAIAIPQSVYRIGSLIETSNNWQLSSLGVVEFRRLASREFWMDCIHFVDDCFLSARLRAETVTKENAISDFIVAYNIPMSSYDNILRSERRARTRMQAEIEKRRTWVERLNDTALAYT